MIVDIRVKKVPSYAVASLIHYGPHGPNMFRAEFDRLVKWAKKNTPRLVYSGIYGWLRYSDFEATRSPAREVYSGNPWTKSKAWANAEVQVPIKKR
jgi:effector-binding domain-containing protein